MTDQVGTYQLLMANGKATLQDVLDLHAHELAKTIRASARTLNDPHGMYRTYVECGKLFGDLIDPGVGQ